MPAPSAKLHLPYPNQDCMMVRRGFRELYFSSLKMIRAFFKSLRFSSSTWGKERSNLLSAWTNASATTMRVNHLWSAGTTYQGARLVLVFRIIPSYALMYSSQCCRSRTSEAENFQFFSG